MKNKLPEANNTLLTIQDAAKYLKVSTKTLRRWEESGVINSLRTSGGHRRYNIYYLEQVKKGGRPKIVRHESSLVERELRAPRPEPKIEAPTAIIAENIALPEEPEVRQTNLRPVLARFALFCLSLLIVSQLITLLDSKAESAGEKLGKRILASVLGDRSQKGKTADEANRQTQRVLAQSTAEGASTFDVNVEATFAEDVTFDQDIAVNGGDISSTSDIFNLATTSTTLFIGGATGTTTVNNNLTVTDNLDVNGTTNDIAGTLNLSGNTLTSSADLLIDPGGGGVSIGTGTAGNVDLTGDDFFVSGDFEVDGSSYIPTLVINSDTVTDITGAGLQVSGGTLSTTLGTSITTSEIENDTILEVDFDATNDATNGYALTYDSSSGGFTWTNITAADENGIETVQESDVTINSVTSTTIDFLGGDFDLSESPAGELNVQLAATLASVTGVSGNFDVAGQLVAGTADAFTVTTAGEIQIPSTQTLQIGTIELNDVGASNVTSGAVLIGVFDELANSSATNLQDVLDDLDSAIGAGSSKWTQDTGFTYLTSTTDDLVVGGATIAAASLYFDESAGNLYLGTNETLSGTLTLYSSGAGITDATIATDASGNLIIDSANFDVTTTGINATAIGATTRAAGAFTTLAANSTVTFSSLVTDGPVITTSGVLSSEATLALARGGTNKNITASNGQVVYSDADSFELTTSGATDECLKFQSGTAPIWEECVTSAQVPFTSDGSVITKTTIGEYLSLRYGDAADTQLEIQNTTSGTIPAADTMAINLTGGTTGIVTDGADGLYIAAEYGNGTTNTNSLLHLDLDPVNTPSGDETFYALNIDDLTGSAATEIAANFGTGWDREINFADTSPTISIGNTGTLSITDGTNTLFTIADDTAEGDVTATGDLAVNGATSADITSTTTTATLFNSGVTTLSIGGAATTLNLADGAVTGIIDIGGVTADGATTVNIATNSTSADGITIGNSNAATTLALTGGDDWAISNGGVITLSASGAQTTAIVATDTDYTNFANIGDNNIIGTTAGINFDDFDVDSDGKTIIGPDTAGDALTLTLATDVRGLVVDASSTDSTTTTGVLDFNIDAGNAAVLGLNIDFAQSDGATADTDAVAQSINLSANDANGDVFGLLITGTSTANAAAGSYEALLKLVNAEPTIGAVTDGILIDSTSGTDTDITDAIDVSDDNIVNAINIGANAIAGTNFAVSAAGTIAIASGQTLTVGTTSLNETTGAADSGAFLVGTFDEFTNSNGANVQDVLDDLDAAIGAGSSKWSINTTPTPDVLYPTASDTTAGNDFALGGTTIDASPFAVDVSANTIYVGDAATAGSTSVIFKSNAGAATGTLAYNTSDQFEFTGGDVVLGDTLTLTSDANQGINGGGLTDCDDAVNSKLLWDAASNKFSCGTDGGAGTGTSKWTDGGAITYLTEIADDIAVGATNTLVAPFSVDVSANTVRIGDATVAGNAVLSLFASDGDTGNLTYNTSDQFQFSGGDVVVDQDLTVTGGDIVSVATTNLLNVSSTTINFGGAATTLNIADAAITGTIDIGGITADGATTVNIATNSTTADTIAIGNSNASTTLALTGGDDWSITAAGALDINGQFDLGDGGDTGTISTSDWAINATGDASGIGAITADGAIAFTPGSTSDVVFTGDADSNFQVASTVASDVTLNVVDITLTATGTGATNTLNGLAITNAAATGTTTPDSLIYIAQSDTDETVTNGIFIENTAGGTLSTGLRITETAGTITDAILISGTLGNILNTDSLDISGGGAITGGTGIVSSGTITFSGLSTGVVTNTSGTLSSEAQLALTRGGTNKDITATAGTVVYSDADSFELTALGSTGQCLTSNGAGAPTWAACDTAATTPFTTSGGIIDKTTAGDRLRLLYGDAADTQLTIENTTNGTIPTVDAMQIDLTGGTTGLVTDGADGLQIATEFGNGTANTNSALHLDVNPVDTPSGDETFYALNIDGLSAGTSATEAAINIGANWDSILNTPSIDITGTGAVTGATSFNGLVVTANDGTITTGTWNGTTIAVANGGTGATTLTSNGVLYGNGTSAIGATTAGTNGQLLLGVTSSAPAFATMSGDATITNAGVLAIAADAVALSTDTTGTYVGDVAAGSGISVSGTPAEGYTETIALGSLTANWSQTGAFDIVLNNADSQLGIRSADDAAFFGTIDVTTLAADRTYTFPDATGTVCLSTGNCTGLGGEITGSGVAGQAAFFTDADSITSENNFEWDSTNDVLSLGTAAVAADTSALLDLYGESEYAVLRPADVTVDGDTNNSGILRLRGTYDSDVAVGPVTSSNFNFDIRNIMTAAGASPASRLAFLNNSSSEVLGITSNGAATLNAPAAETTAITITDTDYTNALSIADNNIIGTTAAINFDNFDVAADGNITVDPAVGIDTNAAGALEIGDVTATTVSIGTTAATTLNLGDGGALTRSINIGTGTGADTINIGTGATLADDINIGGLATSTIGLFGVTSIGDGGTTNYAQFSATGDLTFVGTGDTIVGPATFNLLNSASTTINFAGAATALNIGPTGSGAGSTVLAGGSADTGCTLDHATGNLACSGTVTTTNTSGTVGYWTRDNATTTLTPATAGDDIQLPDSDTFIFGTGDDASITYDGTNLVIDPDLVGSGTVSIAGTEGADKLTVTAGDAVISDGSLLITDDDDAVSFGVTNNTVTTVGAGINTSGLVDISSTSLTTGNLLNLETTTSLTSGRVLNVTSTSTALSTGTLARYDWTPGSATTASGDLLSINIGTNGTTTGDLFSVMDTSSDLFRVNESIITSAIPHEFTSAGDVSMAYDLIFTNETSSKIQARGPLTIEQGDSFESNPLTLQVYNAGNVVVDGSTDVNTGTTGVLDLNVNSITTSNVGFNLDYTINDGAGTAAELFGARLNFTQNDADADLIGLEINAADSTNAVADGYEALLRINGNDTTANAVSDYILITTAATDTTSDAIDVSDSGFFNAINVGTNVIGGTAAAIDFTDFDVSTAGVITLGGGETADITSATDTNLTISAGGTGDIRLLTDADTDIVLPAAGFTTCTALETVANVLTCGSDGGGGVTNLQTAYEGGNSITTAEADGDIDFVLADTVSDQNFDIDIDADNTVSITRNAGASAEAPAQLLLLENADTDITATSALGITNTGGNFTNGILLTDTAGGTFATGLNYSGTFTTGIDLSGGTSTTDIILDDGATLAQTSDADIDIVEGGLTLNLDFAETTASTITYSSASDLTFSSTAALNLTSSEAANDAIVLTTSDVAGGIDITSASTTVDALDVSLAINSGLGFDIDANSLTSGRVFDIASTATGITGTTTTGSLLNLSASGVLTSAFVGNLGYIEWAPGSTATTAGNLLTVNIGTNGTTTGDLFQVQDTGSDLFRVNEAIITSALPHEFTAAGDVSIAYDIQFTNQTASYIKSKAPLYFDVGETFESNTATFNIYNAGGLVVDGSTDVNTGTTGVLDLNVNSITTGNVGFNLDYTIDSGAGTAAELFGARLNLTQNDADADLIGLEINAALSANAGADDYEALLRINGNDTTANAVSDYIIITTAATDTTSDGIDLTDSGLFNAINVDANFIEFDGIRAFEGSPGVLTIEDTAGNDLCTITDNANVGDLNCTGVITQAGSPLTNYWQRNTTTLSPATANDVLAVTSTDNTNATLAITNNTANTLGAGINTAGIIDLSSTSLTTGNLLNLETTTSLTTGTMLNLSTTATALAGTADSGRGLLANFDWNPGSSVTGTGDLFRIRLDTNGSLSSGSIFNVVDESTSLFNVKEASITSAVPHSFTAAGDVSIAYDLLFTNQTASTIKANGPLTIEQGESSENNNISIVTYGTGIVDVEGSTIQLDLSGGTTDEALCGNDADATTNDVLVDDCSGTPALDYAEVHPTASDVEFGDIVTTGSRMIQILALDGENNVVQDGSTEPTVELVKSNIPYQSNVIGIASNNYGDFSSIGHNRVNEADHPLPIALNGRVPVKVSQSSDAIQPGDFITTSTEPGKAMKATSSGFIIAKALESWTPNTGKDTVLVFISNFYYSQSQFAESQDASSSAQLTDRVTTLESNLALLQTQMDLGQEASSSANFTDLTVNNLTVLNDVVLGDTVINGKLNVGTLQFDNVNNSIDAIGTLKIQPMALSGIEFLGGLITFDTNGNIVAKEVTAEKYNVAGASAGTDTLPANETEVFISSTAVEANSLILVTPKTLIDYPLIVTDKQDGLGFSVKMSVSSSTDTLFDWFIVDHIGQQ